MLAWPEKTMLVPGRKNAGDRGRGFGDFADGGAVSFWRSVGVNGGCGGGGGFGWCDGKGWVLKNEYRGLQRVRIPWIRQKPPEKPKTWGFSGGGARRPPPRKPQACAAA